MGIAVVYLLLFMWLLYKWGQQFLFKDTTLSKKFILFLYLLKVLAIPAFYLVYLKLYGGIAQFDTGKYFSDARIISQSDLSFFMRLLFGLQDDTLGSEDYTKYLQFTQNWDNGTVKDYLYNDNRVVIRLHALLDKVAGGSYFAHALFSCSLSFLGIAFLYRAFATEWQQRKQSILLVMVCFPALWFYTGALLKEGLVVFIMGASALALQKTFDRKLNLTTLVCLIVLLLISLLLKPYLLFSFFCMCLFYFATVRYSSFKKQLLVLIAGIIALVGIAEISSRLVKHRSLYSAAMQHQQRFEALGRGGLFMTDGRLYMQLPPDTTLIRPHPTKPKMYTITKGTNYMYWEPNKASDTLYARIENDSTLFFEKLYFIAPAGSSLHLNKSSGHVMFLSALYNSLCVPFFINASGALQLLASFENLLLLVSLLLIIFYVSKNSTKKLWLLIFCGFALALFMFVGLTAPNSGAIFRYRAPIAIFLPIAALMVLPRKESKS